MHKEFGFHIPDRWCGTLREMKHPATTQTPKCGRACGLGTNETCNTQNKITPMNERIKN